MSKLDDDANAMRLKYVARAKGIITNYLEHMLDWKGYSTPITGKSGGDYLVFYQDKDYDPLLKDVFQFFRTNGLVVKEDQVEAGRFDIMIPQPTDGIIFEAFQKGLNALKAAVGGPSSQIHKGKPPEPPKSGPEIS
jgi:hypothetical protein